MLIVVAKVGESLQGGHGQGLVNDHGEGVAQLNIDLLSFLLIVDFKALEQVDEPDLAVGSAQEKHVVVLGEGGRSHVVVGERNLDVGAGETVLVDAEGFATNHHDESIALAALINEYSVDLSLLIEILRGPNARRLLQRIIKVPQPDSPVAHSAQLVISIEQNDLRVVLGLPLEQQFLANQIILKNNAVHLDQHEVTLRLR